MRVTPDNGPQEWLYVLPWSGRPRAGRLDRLRIKPFTATPGYVNYLDRDETGDQVAAAYGSNYRRLQRLKKKYDPTNHLFHMNQNIRPGS